MPNLAVPLLFFFSLARLHSHLYASFFYLSVESVSLFPGSDWSWKSAGLWSLDAGERESRPAPSREKPYTHMQCCWQTSRSAPRVFTCAHIRHSDVRPLPVLSWVSLIASSGCRETPTDGGWGWQRGRQIRDKKSQRRPKKKERGTEITDRQVYAFVFPRGTTRRVTIYFTPLLLTWVITKWQWVSIDQVWLPCEHFHSPEVE